jgi:hypothetical protein
LKNQCISRLRSSSQIKKHTLSSPPLRSLAKIRGSIPSPKTETAISKQQEELFGCGWSLAMTTATKEREGFSHDNRDERKKFREDGF